MAREEAIDLRTTSGIELRVVIVKEVKYSSEKVQTLGGLYSVIEMVWKANSVEANEVKYFIESQSLYKTNDILIAKR